MIEHLRKRIHPSGFNKGGDINNALSNYLVITESEEKWINDNYDISDLAKELKVEYISVKRTGSLSLCHMATGAYVESIKRNNMVLKDTKWVSELGEGSYFYDVDNIEAVVNMIEYIFNVMGYGEEETILVCEVSYSGDYEECIYGYMHEGHIIINEDVGIDSISEYTAEEYLNKDN